jgi:cell filamentation protein, protein adenylyltransferase
MQASLDNLEEFLHADDLPLLIQCGLAHAQFETVHPFLDGNGRVGRLLITFLLCQKRALERDLLYLSHYLKQNHAEYYDRPISIRANGDWEGWLKFFIRGSTKSVARPPKQLETTIGGCSASWEICVVERPET